MSSRKGKRKEEPNCKMKKGACRKEKKEKRASGNPGESDTSEIDILSPLTSSPERSRSAGDQVKSIV